MLNKNRTSHVIVYLYLGTIVFFSPSHLVMDHIKCRVYYLVIMVLINCNAVVRSELIKAYYLF
jgi:hypothetical protein